MWGRKGAQFMTWSGMHTGREGEGNPTPLVERAVNHMTVGGGACRGADGRGGVPAAPTRQTPRDRRRRNSVKRSGLLFWINCPVQAAAAPSLSVKRGRWRWGEKVGGGLGSGRRSCSISPKWEQTQLTASFLTVNIAAPLRHGSGTRTPPPRPVATALRHVTPPSASTFHLHPNTPLPPQCWRIFRRMRRHRVNRTTPEGRTGRADGFHR